MRDETNSLIPRHIGPNESEIQEMMKSLQLSSWEDLSQKSIPKNIQYKENLGIGPAKSEVETVLKLKEYASKNQIFKSYIGMGYHAAHMPTVVQRNILENPGWYTQYTPYQAEISQGRLEALLNFQTMVSDLTALPVANSSLLDEGTAAAEAMALAKAVKGKNKNTFFVSDLCHPQTIEVVETRAHALGIEVVVGNHLEFHVSTDYFGVLLQYPATDGRLFDYSNFIREAQSQGAMVTMACDILSLTLLKPPGELGADIAVGTTQRFGLGMFYGGPHAAFFATKEEYKRQIPGRIVGITRDAQGKQAIRLALQTREQHIRRDKATSNICTAQVLLAVAASMYAIYHGPEGLVKIAKRIHHLTSLLAAGLKQAGLSVSDEFFDCVTIATDDADTWLQKARAKKINLRRINEHRIAINLDETTTEQDVSQLLEIFSAPSTLNWSQGKYQIPQSLVRSSAFMTHPNFHTYQTEHELLRYIYSLQKKDLSLTHSMIPLGSCTMKLNATSEMLSISWPEFDLHPFAPIEQAQGYQLMFKELEDHLARITGFDAVSLQPNAGSQGEYAGLLVIREYHRQRGEQNRNICLIPTSAHGTNPASAVMAGMKVVAVACDESGNIHLQDLKNKAEEHAANLAALMVTYPSTYGVFEEQISTITATIHQYGGQVYLDGANMNAQVGLCRPGDYGADVCHLNLHKTFAIPHGGGGPGMGPICVKAHLKDYLPGNKTLGFGPAKSLGAISAAPWGSAIILNISWSYIQMMGDEGLKLSSQVAILNANYMAAKLKKYYPVLFTNEHGFVAHECIIDTRVLKKLANIEVVDVAKRLMDYGFHAPTMSWPVIGTLMIEPTESENKKELDRFCDAMIGIYAEAMAISEGRFDKENNPLKNAPHTAETIISDTWDRPYSRELAAFPAPWTRENKFWPTVSRVDDAFGDKNLICTCPSVEELAEA